MKKRIFAMFLAFIFIFCAVVHGMDDRVGLAVLCGTLGYLVGLWALLGIGERLTK